MSLLTPFKQASSAWRAIKILLAQAVTTVRGRRPKSVDRAQTHRTVDPIRVLTQPGSFADDQRELRRAQDRDATFRVTLQLNARPGAAPAA